MRFLILPCLLLPTLLPAQKFHAYVGRVDAESVLLAWGTTVGSGNTIGNGSAPHGRATVSIGGKSLVESGRNWVLVRGLQPGQEYPYEVLLGNRKIGWGKVRTWPRAATRLAFFVIGDYGTGERPQYEVAAAMRRTFLEKEASDNRCGLSSPRATISTPIATGSACPLARRRTGSRIRADRSRRLAPGQLLLPGPPALALLQLLVWGPGGVLRAGFDRHTEPMTGSRSTPRAAISFSGWSRCSRAPKPPGRSPTSTTRPSTPVPGMRPA